MLRDWLSLLMILVRIEWKNREISLSYSDISLCNPVRQTLAVQEIGDNLVVVDAQVFLRAVS